MRRTFALVVLLAFVLSAGVMAAGKMVRCAFDDMAMKESMMKKATVKGETLYFCSDAQKNTYVKSPQKYWRTTKVGDLKATIIFLTHKEHMQAMKGMGMKMKMAKKPTGTHHVAVCLQDKNGKDVKPTKVLIRLTDPKGKGVTKPLMWMQSMSHYGADFDLAAKGKYKAAVMVLDAGRQLRSSVGYTVK